MLYLLLTLGFSHLPQSSAEQGKKISCYRLFIILNKNILSKLSIKKCNYTIVYHYFSNYGLINALFVTYAWIFTLTTIFS